MLRYFVLVVWLIAVNRVHATDATSSITNVFKSGHWQVVEFAATEQLFYRVSTEAINTDQRHLTFDFVPSKNCQPTAATMIAHFPSYRPYLDEGIIPLVFKISGQEENTEFTKTSMERSDNYAFFEFHALTTQVLLKAQDKGSLAIWVPASGNGTVKRSANTYFSLDGFAKAYAKARRSCIDNR